MQPSLSKRCATCGYRFESTLDACPTDGTDLGPARPELATLGTYRLVKRLGVGGMGVVYRAEHLKLGRPVAIKILHRSLLSDRGIISRFFYEARAVNTIRHQNVVDIYDFVEGSEDVYLVMEHLSGMDLHDAIHQTEPRGPMAPARAVGILVQVAGALHAAHARNIIHRDMKPENVFLVERNGAPDFVKVLDFGIAKLERPDGRMTVDGAVLGTPEYMSPEQARGEPVDARSDIYSMGCLAYEMLTARQIFGGGGYSDVIIRQINDPPPPLTGFVPGIPAALEAVVLQAMAKSAGARPQTALELAEGLSAAVGKSLDGVPAFHRWRTSTPVGEVPAMPRTASVPSLPRLRSDPGIPRLGHRQRRMLGGVVGVLAVIALGIAGLTTDGRKQPAEPRSAHKETSPSAPLVRGLVSVNVLLQSIPAGAQIVDESGQPLGVTPHNLVLPAGREWKIRFQKAGYLPAERTVRAVADTTLAVPLEAEPRPPSRGRPGAGKPARRLDSAAGTIDPFAR